VLRRRLRLSAAAGAGLLIAASAAILGTTPTVAAPADEPTVQVTIDTFGPVAPKPGQQVVIKGTVTNTSSTTFDKPQAIACIDNKRLSTAADLAEISTEQDKPMDQRKSCVGLASRNSPTFQAFDAPLAPKASVQFTLTVPWQEWHINSHTGVYVVGVMFRGEPDGKDRVTAGRARTLMPVIGAEPLTRTVNTALVIPLRHRPTQLGGKRFANDSLAGSLAPNGLLGRLLAVGKQRKVTWLVDPAMLDEVRQLKDGYVVVNGSQTTPGTGQKVATAWLKEFDASRARGNQVVLLPYGDPDVAGLLDAGGTVKDLVRDARATTERYILPPGFTNGLWLENGAAASRYLAAASGGFPGATNEDLNLVSSSSWPASERPALASSPVYDVQTPEGWKSTVRTVVADSALTAGGPDPDTSESAVQVRQRFAAETALIAAGGKGAASVVAVPPRGWDSNGRATAALVGDLSLPWITPTDVKQVVAAGPKPPTTKAPAAGRVNSGFTNGQLDGIKKLNDTTATLRSLLADPEDLPETMPQALLRSTSTSWRGFPDESKHFTAIEIGSVNQQLAKVHLVNTSVDKGLRKEIKVNLAGSKGTFPLTITNDLPWSVRVGIVVKSANRTDLRIEPLQTVILGPKKKWTPRISASAEQNGLIRANAQVITASELPVGKSQELVIQASQYGSVGWVLVGAACTLLFGTSFVRIYRRIRNERRNPSAKQAPAEPRTDPLHPAPLAARPEHSGDLAEPEQSGKLAEPPANGVPDIVPAAPADESLKEGVGSKDG
jgi:Family of unknown function (DUF6049)